MLRLHIFAPLAFLALATPSLAQDPPATAHATAPTTTSVTRPATAPTGLQLTLRASREEWQVIGPLVDRVTRARRLLEMAGTKDRVTDPLALFGNDAFIGPSPTARGGLGFVEGFTGWGVGTAPATGPASTTQAALTPLPDTGPTTTEKGTLSLAMQDLQAAAADPKTTDSALRDKLALVRLARAKAQLQLQQANQSLRRVVTVDQEALLVALGILD